MFAWFKKAGQWVGRKWKRTPSTLTLVLLTGQWLVRQAWWAWGVLVFVTVLFGTIGFLATRWDPKTPLDFSDALYRAISLLAIATGNVQTTGNWGLEVARWTGMAFWATAVFAVFIRLFGERLLRRSVRFLAKNHVIVTGLGKDGVRLVEALRKQGRTVVVIEPDRNHPSVEACRRAAAAVLFGDPADDRTLLAAKLKRAATVLALFPEEGECVRIATAAYRLLHEQLATPRRPVVHCVVRLVEPGMLEKIRMHQIKRDNAGRFRLEVLNAHEIAATVMVREAVAYRADSPAAAGGEKPPKLLVIGLGEHHRLGEMVVLRAAKDHFIANGGPDLKPMTVHVCDERAETWYKAFRTRHPGLDRVCAIKLINCAACKIGHHEMFDDGPAPCDLDYDAAFVCCGDESHATSQAVMLRKRVLGKDRPIMVAVRRSKLGYGDLIRFTVPGAAADAGWGENLHPVGIDDALFDPATATGPEIELLAQAIHFDYPRINRLEYDIAATPDEQAEILGRKMPPWSELDEQTRRLNRELAERYDAYLDMIEGQKTIRYRRQFAPIRFDSPTPAAYVEMRPEDLQVLTPLEHERWLAIRLADGWTYGAVRDRDQKKNPFIKPFTELTPARQRYASHFIRNMVRILAMADYAVEVEMPGVAKSQPGGNEPAADLN